jgi:zinc transport system substrate-binding protein
MPPGAFRITLEQIQECTKLLKPVLKKSVLLVLLAIVVSGCGTADNGAAQDSPTNERFTIVTTIYPLLYFTSRITGADTDASVDVLALIGSGAEAHTFEPTPADIQLLASADLIVANGLDLEPWLDRAIDALGETDTPVVEAANVEGIRQRNAEDLHHHDGEDEDHHEEEDADHHDEEDEDHHEEEGALRWDPHLWLDPVLAAAQVEHIRDSLVAADPNATDIYVANAADLLADLASLDAMYASRLAECTQRHFITTHAAYGYVADRYGLEQISIAGLTPEAEPSPRDLADLVEQVRALGLTHVLVEPSLSSRVAETLAAETNLGLLPIHQLESVTPDELSDHGDYLGLMRANLDSLTTALGCAA